ncbi:MAG: phosphoethanolamine methyltransferase, partial [Rhodospirillales bacterium]|nr:phosphoethanolamine methyltransferase [Rhodospirillales bacterium]
MSAALRAPRGADPAAPLLFLRRWLANPLQMGSIVPSSPALCQMMVEAIGAAPQGGVLELGAGTGVIGRALLASGLPPERLIVAEIVPEMAAHLRRDLPGALVLEGDARRLPELVPPAWHG